MEDKGQMKFLFANC